MNLLRYPGAKSKLFEYIKELIITSIRETYFG